MSEQIKWVCNCGCRASAINDYEREGWLTINQQQPVRKGDFLPGSLPKLEGTLHFKGLDCLSKWTTKAVKSMTKMLESAKGMGRRGDIKSPSAKGLYI